MAQLHESMFIIFNAPPEHQFRCSIFFMGLSVVSPPVSFRSANRTRSKAQRQQSNPDPSIFFVNHDNHDTQSNSIFFKKVVDATHSLATIRRRIFSGQKNDDEVPIANPSLLYQIYNLRYSKLINPSSISVFSKFGNDEIRTPSSSLFAIVSEWNPLMAATSADDQNPSNPDLAVSSSPPVTATSNGKSP
ncbi:hypothetical protein ACLOJK_040627 [Asimina triloba]